jgi:hypothetical protein
LKVAQIWRCYGEGTFENGDGFIILKISLGFEIDLEGYPNSLMNLEIAIVAFSCRSDSSGTLLKQLFGCDDSLPYIQSDAAPTFLHYNLF